MSNKALDLAPNFCKIGFRIPVKAQVGYLSGKCAPLDRAM